MYRSSVFSTLAAAVFAIGLVVFPADGARAHAAPASPWAVESISDPEIECASITESSSGLVAFEKRCGPVMDVQPLECRHSDCGGPGLQLESGGDSAVLHGEDVGLDRAEYEEGDEFSVLVGWTLEGEDEGTVRLEGTYYESSDGCVGCSSGGSEARMPYGELIIAALLLGAVGLFRREPRAVEHARDSQTSSGA